MPRFLRSDTENNIVAKSASNTIDAVAEKVKEVAEIPESLKLVFQKIGWFIDSIVIVFMNLYVLIVVIVFFVMIWYLVRIIWNLYLWSRKYVILFSRLVKLTQW